MLKPPANETDLAEIMGSRNQLDQNPPRGFVCNLGCTTYGAYVS